MRAENVPLVKQVVQSGPDDSIYDAMLLAGPVLLLVIALLGRSPATVSLAVLYLVGLGTNLAKNGVDSLDADWSIAPDWN